MPSITPMHVPQFSDQRPRIVPHPQGHTQGSMPGGVPPMGQSVGDEGLANRMGKLHLDSNAAGKTQVVVDQDYPPRYSQPLDSSSLNPLYERWVFCRSEPENGQKACWKEIPCSQAALEKKIRDSKKKTSAIDPYQGLGKSLRAQVNDLISAHERQDPRFQWTCEYAELKKQEIRPKGTYLGAVKTVELTVVIMRKLRPEISLKATSSSSSSSTRSPFSKVVNGTLDPESKGNQGIPGMSAQFGRSPVQGAFPASMASTGQHPQGPTPQAQQQQTQHPQAQHPQVQHPQAQFPQGQYPQSQQPFYRPGQDFMMGGQRPTMGTMPPQQKAHFGGQPAMMSDRVGSANPKGSVGVETWEEKTPLHSRDAAGHASAQSSGYTNTPFTTFAQRPRKPQANMGAPKVFQQGRHSPKSPKIPAPEPNFTPDTSSVEDDDDSLRFEDDEDSSATEDLPEDNFERPKYPRGSLHPQRRHSKQGKDGPSYRNRYRRQSQKISGGRQHRYSDDYVDIIPGSSLRARREPDRRNHYYSNRRGRPRVIHDDLGSIPDNDITDLDEKIRERERERDYEFWLEQQLRARDHMIKTRLLEESRRRRDELLREEGLRREALAYGKAFLLNRRHSHRVPRPLRHDLDYDLDYLARDDLVLL
ncbi:hypothetical protein T310_6083 [Rasamsonia emersonii CBS 393.64]|uniref:Uncharacterized protein n=1 Tax=Rasamsonia emersonii (strain ATCC 16479 / CBS 393.64 / IMI 116815) TaxID=1408163 RepID=A0A0F4YQL7_RASE3|nr:hypothetical protein T310_6083 [Rasamsonia emersonii CBS 393.64]KKA19923.1 hypothetical protein T310_6083 [Rasamsonia emersonii CBS 393.64]